jgi:DNA-binding CsgD family transcriptional regulator
LIHGNEQGLEDLFPRAQPDDPGRAPALLGRVIAACRELDACSPECEIVVPPAPARELCASVSRLARARGGTSFVVRTTRCSAEDRLRGRCQELGMSARETDVARLVATGASNTEIGRCLFISPRTVENHLRSIYAKARVNRRTQLLSRLWENRLA